MSTNALFLSAPGIALPERTVDNDDVIGRVRAGFRGSPEELAVVEKAIRDRLASCGTETRHVETDLDASLTDYTVRAARACLKRHGVDVARLGLVIYGGVCREKLEPGTAMEVAGKLGVKTAIAFDITTACAGLMQAVQVASAMMAADPSIDVALCCTTELTQRHLDFDIQSTADLETKMAGLTIGDGAAAWLLTREPLPGGGARLLATRSVAMPEFWPHCGLPVGGKFGSRSRLLFKHMTHMPRELETLVSAAGWRFADVDLFLFHQPSVGLLTRLMREIGVDEARAPMCHHRYGNTSTATVPLAMAHAMEQRALRDGDKVVFAAMGAGASFVMAAAVWTESPVAVAVAS